MPKKKKPANQLTDTELAKRVFPAGAYKRLKDLALELDNKPRRKAPTKKPKA